MFSWFPSISVSVPVSDVYVTFCLLLCSLSSRRIVYANETLLVYVSVLVTVFSVPET